MADKLRGPSLVLGIALSVCLTGCGSGALGGSVNQDPTGAGSARAAVVDFLHAFDRRDAGAVRRLMTPMAQQNEEIEGGLLRDAPELTSFKVRDVERENPRTNASPAGSIASLRYTVSLSPAAGFDNDDTSGSAYGILVSETSDKQWLVAELGGGG